MSVFSAWCIICGADPVLFDISMILSFLQELLEKGCYPSMLKVHVAAIAASQALIDGQSVGRNNLVVRFLKGPKVTQSAPICPQCWGLWRALLLSRYSLLTFYIYIERSTPFRQSEQLFMCFGGHTKGSPFTKQRLSRWIIDAITLAYSSLGQQCPIGVRAHSTRGIASSWA